MEPRPGRSLHWGTASLSGVWPQHPRPLQPRLKGRHPQTHWTAPPIREAPGCSRALWEGWRGGILPRHRCRGGRGADGRLQNDK